MRINEIFLLWKIQLLGFFGVNQAKNSKSRAQKKKARGFFTTAIISVLAFAYLSAQYSFMLCSSLAPLGKVDLVPELMFTACCALVLFTTVIKAASTLFGEGDTDLLMSLPIKTGSIIASRVLVLFTMDFIYTASFLLPMGVVYTRYADPGASGMIMFAVMFLFSSFVPGVLACIISVLLAWISSFFKRTTMFKNLFSLIFMVGILFVSFSAGSSNSQQIASIGESLAGGISKVFPLAPLFSRAMCKSDFAAFLIFIGVSVATFVLFCAILGVFFKKLVSVVRAKRTGAKYKLGELRASSPFKTLYKKELKRFFGSNLYFMNSGIGSIMTIIIAIALIAIRKSVFEQMGEENAELLAIMMSILPFILAWGICLCCPSSCSISLEGKNFWLIRSLPVSARDVLMAKVAMNLTITAVPALFSSAALCIFVDMSVLNRVMLILIPLLYSVFSALLGIMVNLKYPSLDWKNEAAPIKQSTASFISTLGFMPLSIIPAILVGALHAFYAPVISAIAVVLAALSLLLYRRLANRGEALLSAVE